MKKSYFFICFLSVSLLSFSQTTEEVLSPLEKAINTAKYYIGHTWKPSDEEWLGIMEAAMDKPFYKSIEETGNLSKDKNGNYTFSCWGAGLYVHYDYDKFDFPPFKVEGMRGRPTGSTTIIISQQAITIKTYNDVQYATEFYENTGSVLKEGSAKKPDDAYTECLGCKSGSRSGTLTFQIGNDKYKSNASVTCQHNVKRLLVRHGSNDPGSSSDFLSPWKFSHTLTCRFSFSDMAKSVGISSLELKKMIVSEGLKYIGVNNYVFWIDTYSDIFVYTLAKQLGCSVEDVKRWKEEIILAKAQSYYERGREAVKEKQRSKAVDLLESATLCFKEALNSSLPIEKQQQIMETYFSALRIQTFNAYRLMKTEGTHGNIYKRNYDYFYRQRDKAPTELIMIENGVGLIDLEIKDYDEAIKHLLFVANSIVDNPDRRAVNENLLYLAKAYLGANMKEKANVILDDILKEDPQNSEAIECKKQIGL